LKKSDVILYSFHIPNIGEYFAGDGEVILDDLSSLTGGRAYFPRVKTLNKREEVDDVFAYVASELRHQYVLTVNPRNPRRVGDWRKIRVRVSQQSTDRADKKKVYVRFRENHFIQQD